MGRGQRKDNQQNVDPHRGSSEDVHAPDLDAVSVSHEAEQSMQPVSQDNLGSALAESFGTSPRGGARAIASRIGSRSLIALAGSAGASLAFGTPLLPVAGVAVGGYLAAKGVSTWRKKRDLDKATALPHTATENTTSPDPQDPIAPDPLSAPSDLRGAESSFFQAGQHFGNVLGAAAQHNAEAEKRQNQLQETTSQVRSVLEEDATSSLDAELREELRIEGMAAGNDFGEKVHPEALEARKIMLTAGSVPVDEEERDEVIKAIAATERPYLEKGPLKERVAALAQNEKDLERVSRESEKEEIKKFREDLKQQSLEYKELLEEQKQQAQMVIQNIENAIPQIMDNDGIDQAEERIKELQEEIAMLDQSIANIPSQQEQILEEKIPAIQKSIALWKEEQKQRLQEEREALLGDSIGDVDGLANLTTRGSGVLACRRCGTQPKTIRRRCSRCGVPFVIEPDYRTYIGRGDEDLLRMNKLALLEQHEGSAEERAERWSQWRDGVRATVPKPQKTAKAKPSGPEKPSGSRKASSKENPKRKTEQKEADLQSTRAAGLDGSEADYIAARNQARKKAGGEIILSGLTRFGPEEEARLPKRKDQASCVVDGQFPMDFGAASNKGSLGKTQEGDRVMIRQNAGSSYEEKNRMRLLGYADVRKTVRHSFSPEEMQNPEAVRKRLGEIWDENNLGEIQDIFTRDRFIEYNTEDILYGDGTPEDPLPRPNFSLILYENVQKFDEPIEQETENRFESAIFSQGGGKRLRPEGPAYQDIIDASYRKDYENGGGSSESSSETSSESPSETSSNTPETASDTSPDTAAKQEKQVRLCQHKTKAGEACKNAPVHGQKFCRVHLQMKEVSEESSSVKQSEEVSSESSAGSAGSTAGSASAEQPPGDIVTVASSEVPRTFAPPNDPSAQAYLDSLNRDPAQSKTIRETGMTEYELAQYANAWLDGLHPKEGDKVILEPSHKSHEHFVKAAQDVAMVRGIEMETWWPNEESEAEWKRRAKEVSQNGDNMIFSGLEQPLGRMGLSRSVAEKMQAGELKHYGRLNEGSRWNVTLMPDQRWANALQNHSGTGFDRCANPLRQLANDLQDFMHSDTSGGLPAHLQRLQQRADKLNEIKDDVEEIHIQDGDGTDLRMKLTPNTEWVTVDTPVNLGSDQHTLINSATDEVWATPVANSLRGRFRSSSLLHLEGTGVVVERLEGEFDDNGNLVKLKALKQNEAGEWVSDSRGDQALVQYFGKSPGEPWPQCGEIGMVDSSGRIAQTGRNYLTTFLDEHGGLHIALGQSYEVNGGGKNGGKDADGIEQYGSEHAEHLDVTIGSPRTTVTMITKAGEKITPILNGMWQDLFK